MWQLSVSANCTIQWGTDTTYSSGSAETSEDNPTNHIHKSLLTTPTEATKYYDKVLVGTTPFVGSFMSKLNQNAENFNFIVYGDTRSTPSNHNIIADQILKTIAIDSTFHTILFHVGDAVSEGDNESYWDSQFFSASYPKIRELYANMRCVIVRGNHERTGAIFGKYFPISSGTFYRSFD